MIDWSKWIFIFIFSFDGECFCVCTCTHRCKMIKHALIIFIPALCRNTPSLRFVPKICLPFNNSCNFPSLLALCKRPTQAFFPSCCWKKNTDARHLIWKTDQTGTPAISTPKWLCVLLKIKWLVPVEMITLYLRCSSTLVWDNCYVNAKTDITAFSPKPTISQGPALFHLQDIEFIISTCQLLLWFWRWKSSCSCPLVGNNSISFY